MEHSIVVSTFYKFAKLVNYRDMQQPLLDLCNANGIRGTILLAEEGINSTVAGSREAIDLLIDSLRDDPRLGDLKTKESFTAEMPFQRMKVRLKKEIVALKVEGIDPTETVGKYVEPEDWNALISAPDIVLIDARNDYETQIGTFKGAINPRTESFHELPAFVEQNLDPTQHKKVAMFCTGGIRCEKATAYMLQQGFEEVYHLNGGILRYLEQVKPEESLWEGECFVFDERVSIDHHLEKGLAVFCTNCKGLLADPEQACPACGAKSHPQSD